MKLVLIRTILLIKIFWKLVLVRAVTDIILKHTKANVYSIDSSNAVFANLNNNKEYIGGRLNLYKASVWYSL